MNNNVVEKTLKSIDNIDRLSDLAAISIYNTSHEAIDKFDVMQEHATPEYVEGEFIQESLLTGVLIGAGIIGVAISAFLIIKKIIESKAKGDPNAASNTPEGADLTKPEDIQKLFDKWKTEYFNKYPDLVVENVKCADARRMSEYATSLTDSVNKFTDSVNSAVDEYMDNGSEEKLIENINDIAATIGSADISAALSSEGRIDQSTIGNLEVSAVAIARSFKEFDGIIKNNIANFEKKAKEKNDKGTEEDGANSKVSEKTIKQFSDILKKKAEETGKIMVAFRQNVLGGFEAAIKAAANEKASSQTKQQTGNGGNGLTDEDKQRILNIMKVYYPESEKQIIDEINVFDAAESAQELKEMLDESYEELKPGKGAKDAFIRIADVAEQVAMHKHFDWPIRATDYKLDRLDSEDTDGEADIDINAEGSGESELKNQNTDEASAETEKSEKHEETPETPETENSNSEGTSPFDDTQVTPEKIEKVISTIESWDPDITLTEKDRKYIDWFLSANNKDSGISDIIDILEKRYKELLNSNESGKLSTFNKYLLMATTSANINGLNAEEINAAFPQNRLDLLDIKSEDMETPSAEEPKSPETSEMENSENHEETTETETKQSSVDSTKNVLNDDALLTAYADKRFGGNKEQARQHAEYLQKLDAKTFKNNIMKQVFVNVLIDHKQSGLNEAIDDIYNNYMSDFKDANISPDESMNDINAIHLSEDEINKLRQIFSRLNIGKNFSDKYFCQRLADMIKDNSGNEFDAAMNRLESGFPPFNDIKDFKTEIEQNMRVFNKQFSDNPEENDLNNIQFTITNMSMDGLFNWAKQKYDTPYAVNRYELACKLARNALHLNDKFVPKPKELNGETPESEEPTLPATSEGTPEAEPAKKEEPVDETEKKDETPLSENANQNIDIQYDGNWVIINGKPVAYSDEEDDNIERKWPDEDNETANKLITGLINRGESPLNAIEDINDLWEYGSRDGNIINFLNGIYSSRNSLDNPNDLKIRTECYNKCKIMAEILGEPPVDELPKPDSVEKPSDDIKKISDSTGLDEGKVENIYKILKDNSTPDDVKRALIIDTIRPIMHMSGFNEDMTNKSFATNYANFKKVAEAANMQFEIEQPEISEKDINNIHTIVDGAGTDETKLAKIADNLMNSASNEKKEEGAEGDKEQELLSRITNGPTFAAEVAKAVDAGIPEDYARTTLSSLTMSDGKYSLIKERLKDYDWLNDFKQREAYKKAYNHYNDALLYFTDKGIKDIPELKDELPDPTGQFPNALNNEDIMQRVLAQYPVNPETLRKDLEYFQAHIPAENLRYIIKDIIPKYFFENAFTKSFEETVNQIRNDDIKVLNLALINANIAEFKPSPEILKQVTDYINANLEKLKSRLTCTILADALVSGIFDPGMIDSETPKENPSSSTAKEIDTTSNDYELTNNPIMTDEEVKNSDIKPFAPKRFSSKDLNITPEERAAQMGVDDRAQIEGILDSYKLAEKLKAGNKSNEEPKTSETPNEIKDKGFDYDYSQDDESNSVKTFTVPENIVNANPEANMDIVNREYSSLMQLIDNGEDVSSTLNSINNLGIYTPATKKAIFDAIKESHPEIDTPVINSDISTSAEPEVLRSDEPSSNADEIINAADTDINPVDPDIEAHKNAALHHYNITEIAKDPKRGYSSDQLTEDINKAIAQAQLAKNKGVPPQKAKDVKTALGNIYKKIKGTGLTGLFPNQDKLTALRSAKNYARYKMMENGVDNYFSEMVEVEAIYQQLVMECEIAIAREEKLKLIMEQTDSES